MISHTPELLSHRCDEHIEVMASLVSALAVPFESLVQMCGEAIEKNGKIVLFGNGGSAADAQHIATELTVRFSVDRPPIAALALTTDTSAITACGNDFGFDAIFSRQVEALVRKDDVAIGISTSGASRNVLNGLDAAHRIGARTVGFTGASGGEMQSICDVLLKVPSSTTARIQEAHIFLGHTLCEALELRLGYGNLVR